MTVLDHMKAAGYDPNAARNADDLRRMGSRYDGMREHPAPHRSAAAPTSTRARCWP